MNIQKGQKVRVKSCPLPGLTVSTVWHIGNLTLSVALQNEKSSDTKLPRTNPVPMSAHSPLFPAKNPVHFLKCSPKPLPVSFCGILRLNAHLSLLSSNDRQSAREQIPTPTSKQGPALRFCASWELFRSASIFIMFIYFTHKHTSILVWRSEDLTMSFHHEELRNQTHILGLGSKCLCLLSHLASPALIFFCFFVFIFSFI